MLYYARVISINKEKVALSSRWKPKDIGRIHHTDDGLLKYRCLRRAQTLRHNMHQPCFTAIFTCTTCI